MVTNVYAPTDHNLKQNFLQQPQQVAPNPDMPWIILGDFNLMQSHLDKNNPTFHQDEANAFNDTINNLALIEPPLTNWIYTWSSNRATPTLQKIDIVFINIAWNQIFPNSLVSSLTRFTLDHVPLLVTISTQIPCPATFALKMLGLPAQLAAHYFNTLG
jgi:endonuclease/exonuclease/phosphatase family metal-dependent hydrolase